MAKKLDSVLIVIPAFNEQETIASVINEVKKSSLEYKILVVNDASSDNTQKIALESGVLVLSLPCNLGVGGAMRLGFKYAVMNNFDVLVQIDADGQHNPIFIPSLIRKLEDFDVVIGSRFSSVGDYDVRGPRKWAMIVLSKVISWFMKTKIDDTTSGFKAHGPKAISIFANEYPAEYLGDTIEALVIGHRAGLSYTQVGVNMRERLGGVPSQNLTNSILYLARAFLALCIAFIRPQKSRS